MQGEIILVKNGELVLKGLNRRIFEDSLVKTLRRRLRDCGKWDIQKAQSAIYLIPDSPDCDIEAAAGLVSKIFGIVSYSRAAVCEKSMEQILARAAEYLKPALQNISTFKVEARRADKTFPLKSPEICREVGAHLLESFPHLSVDVHRPDITVTVEVREQSAFVRAGQLHGAGGMPAGTAGRAGILISGGIDSPVAAWMMARRGLSLSAIHFASPPYTSPRAEEKVRELLRRVSKYSGDIPFLIVPFTEIQEKISEAIPEDYFTLIMRRYMMKISGIIARDQNLGALITGECLGQVASQTLEALACTDDAVKIPVFRPLIGLDKEEIVTVARKIDTFETSVLPFEDCCTVFTPKHPKTKPEINKIREIEELLPENELINRAIDGIHYEKIVL